jgi:hypothetical protein
MKLSELHYQINLLSDLGAKIKETIYDGDNNEWDYTRLDAMLLGIERYIEQTEWLLKQIREDYENLQIH